MSQELNCNNMAEKEEDPSQRLMKGKNGAEEVARSFGADERETWGKKFDFLLSVIGFAVDLANVWRFPYLCYKNGGGAFLIPYLLMMFVGGVPLFYMELALGQFHRKGAITCWGRICPLFKGVGYSVVLIAFFTDFFYNVIIAWALYYFFASFTDKLPWTTCNNTWNTANCYDDHLRPASLNKDLVIKYKVNNSVVRAVTNIKEVIKKKQIAAIALNNSNVTGAANRVSSAQEYFERGMLEINKSDGIERLGAVKWQLLLCLAAVYLICYFSLWKGISTSGKVVWFTALFPYVVLVILLVRGITLPGAVDGIAYYLTPNPRKLLTSEVWVDAATQVFFSLGPGFGVLLAYASYNPFHNNVYMDALLTSSINFLTSFLSGFVIFSVLGYMAAKTGKHISKVATEGPGLVFIVYPEAIATLPASTFWALIFFMMLLTLGLDSSFGGSEAIITALSDEFPKIKKHREIFVAILFSFYFVIGIASCTYGGGYIIYLMERFAAFQSILFAVFFEAIAVGWIYGTDRFSDDIKDMLGFRPGIWWRLCWKFIAPIFILSVLIFALVTHEPLQYDGYVYPWWGNFIGWLIALASILCLPAMAIYKIIRTPGTLRERLTILTTPWRDSHKVQGDETTVHLNMTPNGNNPIEAV